MSTELEDQLRQAMRAEVADVRPAVDVADTAARAGRRRRTRRRLVTTVAAVAVVAVAGMAANAWNSPQEETPVAGTEASSRPADELSLPRHGGKQGDPSMAALARGELVLVGNDCVALELGGDRELIGLVWPPGWTARIDQGQVVVFDEAGHEFARQGETVQIGGGSADWPEPVCGTQRVWIVSQYSDGF